MNLQRAYQIACMMVGAHPEKFKELADIAKMPEDRQRSYYGYARCRTDDGYGRYRQLRPLTRMERPSAAGSPRRAKSGVRYRRDLGAGLVRPARAPGDLYVAGLPSAPGAEPPRSLPK
jgi:hypothetical protein